MKSVLFRFVVQKHRSRPKATGVLQLQRTVTYMSAGLLEQLLHNRNHSAHISPRITYSAPNDSHIATPNFTLLQITVHTENDSSLQQKQNFFWFACKAPNFVQKWRHFICARLL